MFSVFASVAQGKGEALEHKEAGTLAAFLKAALENEEGKPNFALLRDVSDAAIITFTGQLAEALEINPVAVSTRAGAVAAIGAMLEGFQSTKFVQEKSTREIAINSSLPGREENGDQAVYLIPGRAEYLARWGDKLDVAKNITHRILRFQRQLAGWVTLTQFIEVHNYHFNQVRSVVDALIQQEHTRYAQAHPHASPDEIRTYLQKEYIAFTSPKDRAACSNHEYTSIWIDLSPKAQADCLKQLQDNKATQYGEYGQILARPGWVSLDSIAAVRNIGPYRMKMTQWLDAQMQRKANEYQSATGCTSQIARQWVEDAYLWRGGRAGRVRRALSPEAQGDLKRYIEEQKQLPPALRFRQFGEQEERRMA